MVKVPADLAKHECLRILGPVDDATTWELRAIMVVARSRQTRLELADISPSNSLGAYVDDVSVRLVGQPPRAPTPHRPRFAVPPY